MKYAFLLLLFLPQEKPEFQLVWAMEADTAAEYTYSEPVGGKLTPRDRPWLLFAADLNSDGGNNLLVNNWRELPWSLVLQLPREKVKVGSRWPIERDFFEDSGLAFTPNHGLKPVACRGQSQVMKVEKINDVECLRIDGVFQFFDLKKDPKGNRDVGKQARVTLNTSTWVRTVKSVPVRALFSMSGRITEFEGIKQGEEAKQTSVNKETVQIDLKTEAIKVEGIANLTEIHTAIRKGAAWLLTQPNKGLWKDKSGSFAGDFPIGITALCVMALLHSGVKATEPAMAEAIRRCQGAEFSHVYDTAATIMMVETRYLPLEKQEEIEELTEEKARKSISEKITKEDKDYVQRAVDWLLSKQTKLGTWGYPDESDIKDNSNTQYALLGLKSASRCGVRVRSEVWRRILAYWLNTQKLSSGAKVQLKIHWMDDKEPGFPWKEGEDLIPGAWGYLVKPFPADQAPDRGYGSMVCAGLTGLIIAESELMLSKDFPEDQRKRLDSSKKAGFAWLQANYTLRGNPPSAGFWSLFHMYYLYSFERVGVLYGIKKIGGHDWYLEGALLLVKDQRADGSWDSYDRLPVLDTAFALLFLKKATVKVATK